MGNVKLVEERIEKWEKAGWIVPGIGDFTRDELERKSRHDIGAYLQDRDQYSQNDQETTLDPAPREALV